MFDIAIPVSYIPFIALGIAAATVVLIFWLFILKPRFESPLPNEQDEGVWRITLPQLGKVPEGRVSTARNTIISWFAKTIENTAETEQEPLIKLRDSILERHLFAQKSEGDKILYAFDDNPMAPEHHIRCDRPQRFGPDVPVRFIHNVKDCISLGKTSDGFEVVGVKLGKKAEAFSVDQRQRMTLDLEGLKNLKLAAINKQAESHWKALAEMREELHNKTLEIVRKVCTERDEAKTGLSQKHLGSTETPELKGGLWRAIGQKFWTWKQILFAVIAFFIVTNGSVYANVTIPEPNTVGFIVAVIVFFGVPIVEGWRKR